MYALGLSNLNQYAIGQAQPGLSVQVLERVRITFPLSAAEQQKIAACLTSLDELIEGARGKLELLKTHKKGLLQQLFPSTEESASPV